MMLFWLCASTPQKTAREAFKINKENVVNYELNLFDVQTVLIRGVRNEFVHVARLGNLACCFMSMATIGTHNK